MTSFFRLAMILAALALLSGCASLAELQSDCACLEKPINPGGASPSRAG